MNILSKVMVVLVLSAASLTVRAIEFEGVEFPDKITLDGTSTQLQLNGVGFRTKFIFDIYIGALYTDSKAESRDAVQALKGPNRIHMHFVYGEVSKEKLVNGWNDGFENNQSSEQLDALRAKVEKFNAMFSTLVEGNIVLLDYIPGKGTRVTINGEDKGLIEGKEFNTALLDIWLGEEPADDDLKEKMLGL